MFAVLSEVEEGAESVRLPEDTQVEWWHRPEKPDKQERDYRDRVKMKDERVKSGRFSLTLERPTERDSGRYSCVAWSQGNIMDGESCCSQLQLFVHFHLVLSAFTYYFIVFLCEAVVSPLQGRFRSRIKHQEQKQLH